MEELITAIDPDGFKRAMSHFLSGVTVVTTEHNGQRFGMTVASFASLSLSPPLVVVCIDKSVRTHDAIRDSEKFAVNILAQGQEAISNRFASRAEDKFEGTPGRAGKLSLPLIDGATAIECRLHASLPGGDHTIFVGEVIGSHIDETPPLAYYRSAYRRLDKL